MPKENIEPSMPIVYSCYVNRSREGEQFVQDHTITYQIEGSLMLNDGDKVHTFNEGDFRFCRRNQLLKYSKHPRQGGTFRAISIYLDQDVLREIAMEYGFKAEKKPETESILQLKTDPLYKSFMNSLMPYDQLNKHGNEKLLALKLREAILILLQGNPELKNVLFDFTMPGKIDLEAFMNKNFHFNVELKRFAYLTGRSLATFKRDFEKIFHVSPSRWLNQRRLREAHFLIKEKGAKSTQVYMDLGFEDLSHFSFAFKKMYGIAPSRI